MHCTFLRTTFQPYGLLICRIASFSNATSTRRASNILRSSLTYASSTTNCWCEWLTGLEPFAHLTTGPLRSGHGLPRAHCCRHQHDPVVFASVNVQLDSRDATPYPFVGSSPLSPTCMLRPARLPWMPRHHVPLRALSPWALSRRAAASGTPRYLLLRIAPRDPHGHCPALCWRRRSAPWTRIREVGSNSC